MSRKGHTKDERFLVALFDAAKERGDVNMAVNRFEIGKLIGLNPKGINIICRNLLQCNFLKKSGEEDVALTANGLALLANLFEE